MARTRDKVGLVLFLVLASLALPLFIGDRGTGVTWVGHSSRPIDLDCVTEALSTSDDVVYGGRVVLDGGGTSFSLHEGCKKVPSNVVVNFSVDELSITYDATDSGHGFVLHTGRLGELEDEAELEARETALRRAYTVLRKSCAGFPDESELEKSEY